MIIQSPPSPLKMSSTASVQSWLGQELETRGVDAVVYTRYILSIFQQDSFDLEQDSELSLPDSALPILAHHHHHGGHAHPKIALETGGGGGGCGLGGHHHHHHHFHPAAAIPRKDKGRSRWKAKNQHHRWQSPEDLKKDAVVKCLQSVTERDCGIEGLVEELCLKLKKVQEERQEHTPTHSPDATTQTPSDGASQTERYYEAFPALSDKAGTGAKGIRPKGAWKNKPKRNNSTGSMSTPSSDHEQETVAKKSASASVSRNSNSPVGFQSRQYQRAQSLPNSLSRNRNRSPPFVVPKYQGRKCYHNYSHGHDKGNKRHHRDRNWTGYGGERGDGKYKNVSGKKMASMFPEWYQESGEGQADLTMYMYHDDRDAGSNEEVCQEVFVEENPVNGDRAIKEEERLEEAVNTMAESLCRSIMEEWDNDQPSTKSAGEGHELLGDEGEMYLFGSGDSLKEWYAGSTRTADFDPKVGMAPVVVDGPHRSSSSIWEKNLVPGSPLCTGQQEPWENNARSCLPLTTSPSTPATGGAAEGCEVDSGVTSPKSVHEDSAAEEASDTASAGELWVDTDNVQQHSAPISPRNAPIGTGRNTDSLLRICDHTHAHSHPYDPQGPSTPSGVGWGMAGDGSPQALHSTPTPSDIPIDQPFQLEEDSLVQGICSSQKENSLLNISSEPHSLDMNNALWATYENKQSHVHPPKIVTWDASIFTGFQPLAKTSAFIEGGVYGSPYNSHNNSQFNSCSTSPCNDSSIRELWDGAHSREASSVCSLECLLSPQPCGPSCPSIQDEQSVIEDSLVDSPKYLCSRSSSRFDFARSDAENSDNSSGSARGTETDEMISEDEWADEIQRDRGISSKMDTTDITVHKSDNDSTPKDRIPGVLGRESHQGSSSDSLQCSSGNSQHGSFGYSMGSSKGTAINQHLLSVDWKKQHCSTTCHDPVQAVQPPMAPTVSGSADQVLISSESHFKPIPHGLSGNASRPDSLESSQVAHSTDYYQNAGIYTQPLIPSTKDFSGASDAWKPPDRSALQSSLLGSQVDMGFVPAEKAPSIGQSSDLSNPPCEFFPGHSGPYTRTGTGQSLGLQGNPYSSGAGAGLGDPGGGLEGYSADHWSFGIRTELQTNPDVHHLGDEDELFFQEGLLVDQPLEPSAARGAHGRYPRRRSKPHTYESAGTGNVCKDFIDGCCSSGMCGFSHDTSRVTCGQWLEGHCQRGSLCPFLHGYTSNLSSQSSSRAGSRTGSTTPDDAEEAAWDHPRSSHRQTTDWMQLHGYHKPPGGEATWSSPTPGDGGGVRGGEQLRSLPINISSKPR